MKFVVRVERRIRKFSELLPGTIFRTHEGGQCYIRTQRPGVGEMGSEQFKAVRLADGMKINFSPDDKVYPLQDVVLTGAVSG